ncbi:response regulator [Filobacillus milosensis]|uniref:Response regulator n=1 Tax=Filobacillus milosensis TaxID=94137 RepID=A0A4Y8IIL2_9BACI|nr:response regulator [Filobacillus milosensis]TFB19230.1 response regulator [Filobacillus milosensis]
MGEVFVVDDEVGIRLLLSEIIGQEDFKVTMFDNSENALKRAINEPPQLIFLDYLIQPIRGDHVVEKLKEASLDIPVVLISGMAKEEIESNLGENMVYQVLEKPFTVDQVKDILNDVKVQQ